MAFDIKKFLTEDLGLTGDDLALVETKLAPKVSVLEAGFLRQADYSTKMNEIGTLQKQVADKDAALAAEAVEWSKLTAAEKQAAAGLRDSLNKKEAEALALRQKLELVAGEAGLDVTKLLADIAAAPVKKDEPAVPGFDASKFVTAEQYQGLVATAVRLPAMLQTLAREHKQLTGEDLDTEQIVAELETRAHTPRNQKSLNVRDIWEETHGVAEKRAAKAKTEFDAQIKAAEERGAMTARTEGAIPTGGTPRGQHSVVFTRPGAGESVLKRAQPGEGHRSAVAAFTSGKYRTDGAQKSA